MALPTITSIIENRKEYLKGLSKAAHRGSQFVIIFNKLIDKKACDTDINPEIKAFLEGSMDLIKIMASIISVAQYILQANNSPEDYYCLDKIDPLSPEDTFDALKSLNPGIVKQMLLICGLDSFAMSSCLNNNDKALVS